MANYITTDTELTSIANAIRTKGGTQATLEYPTGFVTAIGNIPSGGIDPSLFVIDESVVNYYNYGGQLDNLLTSYMSYAKITFYSQLDYFFSSSFMYDVDLSPLTLIIGADGGASMNFGAFSNIVKLPTIKGKLANSTYNWLIGASFMNSNYRIRNLDRSTVDSYVKINKLTNATGFCRNCYGLRTISNNFLEPTLSGSSGMTFQYDFQNCYSLNKVENYPVWGNSGQTSSAFSNFLAGCERLEKFTFATNNGTPYDVNVGRNLTWDLTSVGYSSTGKIFTDGSYSSSNNINDATTYAAHKNDPDWCTDMYQYSYFNHDSVLALLNSLPNNTNSSYKITIKLNGASGSLTDAGAINTLTAAEQQIATDKGWLLNIV